MKKNILIIIALFTSGYCFSQNGKFVYSYATWGDKLECVHYLYLSDKKVPDVKDYFLKDSLDNVMTFKNEIEFVNYLSNKGWELFQIGNNPSAYSNKPRYYFRKQQAEFTQKEMEKIIIKP